MSLHLLETSPSAAEGAFIVATRQAYLDEFERRDPVGVQAWLDSGARAADDPARFIDPGRRDDQAQN